MDKFIKSVANVKDPLVDLAYRNLSPDLRLKREADRPNEIPPTPPQIRGIPPKSKLDISPFEEIKQKKPRRLPQRENHNPLKGVNQIVKQQQPHPNDNLSMGFIPPATEKISKPPYIEELGSNDLDRSIHEEYPIMSGRNFVAPRRMVHFDLKGAPPRPSYFQTLFPILERLGATSILVEWEDMFPYRETLSPARNLRSYSEQDVDTILQAAKDSNLEIIPLVQTFGHLEWILKVEKYAHLRENPRFPQVMCVGMDEAWALIKEAIDQVMERHQRFGVPFFHIGADEVFSVGECARDRELMRTKHHNNKQQFILWHIARTAKYIRDKHNSRVLAWHDMFANSMPEDLRQHDLVSLIEPVVWNYAENLDYYLPSNTWTKLRPFPYVWGASAYKGADGPGRFYANPMHYLKNHESWINQMNKNYASFKQFRLQVLIVLELSSFFLNKRYEANLNHVMKLKCLLRGLILTGWSRYDHLAALCELLPVGVPSLSINLALIAQGGNHDLHKVNDVLKCAMKANVEVVKNCDFPGAKVYELIQELHRVSSRLHQGLFMEHEYQGWLARSSVRFQVSSNWYLDKLLPKVNMNYQMLDKIHTELEKQLRKHFYEDTVEEFLYDYAEKDLEEMQKVKDGAMQIMRRGSFPLRPFKEFLVREPTETETPGITGDTKTQM